MNNIFLGYTGRAYRDMPRILQDGASANAGNLESFSDSFHNLVPDDPELAEKESRLSMAMNRHRHRPAVPSRPFYEIKRQIEDSPIFKVIRKMPKGGLLHVHSTAGVSVDRLFTLFELWQTTHEDQDKIMVLTDSPDENKPKYLLFYQKDMSPEDTAEPVNAFLDDPEKRTELKGALAFIGPPNEEDDTPWDEFNRIHARTDMLFGSREFYMLYHEAFFEECIEDNIGYVELRCGFQSFGERVTSMFLQESYQAHRHLYFKELLTSVDPNKPDLAFLEAIEEARNLAQAKKKGRLQVKVILTANRCLDPDIPANLTNLTQKVDTAINLFKNQDNRFGRIGDMVIGFDFVNYEDRGFSTEYYYQKIIGAAYGHFSGAEGPWRKIPRYKLIRFFLHDGESFALTPEGVALDNVLAGSVCSSNRIGHGFKLFRYPVSRALIRNGSVRDLPNSVTRDANYLIEPVLEVCPISNQLLLYWPDLRAHPAQSMGAEGLNMVICNDDPQVFDNPGLSYDLWAAYMWMNFSYEEIKSMVFLGFVYSKYAYSVRDGNCMMADFSPGQNIRDHAYITTASRDFKASWAQFLQSDEVQAFIDMVLPAFPLEIEED